MRNWIKKHPALFFTAAAFFISYGIGMPFYTLTADFAVKGGEISAVYLPRLFVVLGPSLAAVITASVSGKSADLFNSLKPDLRQLKTALIFVVITAVLGLVFFILSGAAPETALRIYFENGYLLLFHFITQIFIIGILEETGWRGWLFKNLLKKCSTGKAILIVFIIWSLWHFPLLLSSIQLTAAHLLGLAGVSITAAYLWFKYKGKIFIIAVLHGCVNTTVFFLENRMDEYAVQTSIIMNVWIMTASAVFILGLFLLKPVLRNSPPAEPAE